MAVKRKTTDPVSDSPQPYVVFARRFRPQSFADVVGQPTVTASLRHALRSGRLAQAYLLTGPRGVGKTSLARILAKALNCLSGKGPGGVAEEPCNQCEACLSIQEGRALDVVEMDAATNRGINEIRNLRESVGLSPSHLRLKIYIVDEVHMLTTEAWNAFLKTLEEPPPHVKFVFATTDAEKIPETILSRCQRFDLRRIGPAEMVKRLQRICEAEEIKAQPAALERLAGLARGGLRDAEGLLDQAVNLGEGTVTEEVVRSLSGSAPDELIFEILHACADGKAAEALQAAGRALDAGADPLDLLNAGTELLRGTLLAKTCGPETSLLEGQTHLRPSYAELGAKLSEDQLLLFLQLFQAAARQARDATHPSLPLEMALLRAARARDLVDLGKVVAALESGAPLGTSAGGARSAPAAAAGGLPGAREGPRPNGWGRPAQAAEPRPAADAARSAIGSGSSRPAPAPVPAPVARPPERAAPGSEARKRAEPSGSAGRAGTAEEEAEYGPEGALPLVESVPVEPTPEENHEEDSDAAPPRGTLPPSALESGAGAGSGSAGESSAEAGDLREHPAVRLLVEKAGGEIIKVQRRPRAEREAAKS